jgi:small subunit ribosomal protein S5
MFEYPLESRTSPHLVQGQYGAANVV